MPRVASSSAPGRRSTVTLVLGALLALLTLGAACGPATAGTGATDGTVRVAAPSAPPVAAGTGCGKHRDDQDGRPVAPARGPVHEQLAVTLSYEYGAARDGAADVDLGGVPPDRGPPPRDPPSPVELSVLRV